MAAAGPTFGARMSFAAALANPAANSTGLYRIYRNGRPVYAGRAAPGTIRSRLVNHRWCLTHMGVDDSNYTVSFAPMTGSSTAQVVAAEKNEIRRMRRNRVFRGTNVREGEFEGEAMFGWLRNLWGKPGARPSSQPPSGKGSAPGAAGGKTRPVNRRRMNSDPDFTMTVDSNESSRAQVQSRVSAAVGRAFPYLNRGEPLPAEVRTHLEGLRAEARALGIDTSGIDALLG